MNHLQVYSSESSLRLHAIWYGIGKVSVILPITDEVFLVEDGAVWTKERICEQTPVHVSQGAHVESLVIHDDDDF